MQSETGFRSSLQLKSYVASKSRLKLAARAVLSADAGLLVYSSYRLHIYDLQNYYFYTAKQFVKMNKLLKIEFSIYVAR